VLCAVVCVLATIFPLAFAIATFNLSLNNSVAKISRLVLNLLSSKKKKSMYSTFYVLNKYKRCYVQNKDFEIFFLKTNSQREFAGFIFSVLWFFFSHLTNKNKHGFSVFYYKNQKWTKIAKWEVGTLSLGMLRQKSKERNDKFTHTTLTHSNGSKSENKF
jgi:hypothetical protein